MQEHDTQEVVVVTRPRRARAGSGGAAIALCVAGLLGCTSRGGDPSICDRPQRTGILPAPLDESSGVAASRRHPGVLWTHNDSNGEAAVFAIDETGRLLGSVRVTGARNRDWEDIALGPCPAGDCLYIADTGDNRGQRDDAAIYRVPEPAPGDTATAPAERFPIRYPGSRVDAEALYTLPDGGIYLISKGRYGPITVFRYPGEPRTDQAVELLRIGTLSTGPTALPNQVTGAAAAPDGRWVAVRTYTAVQLYRVDPRGGLHPELRGAGIDLQRLTEPQGEAVAIASDGTIILTSESGPNALPGPIARIDCRLD